MTSHRFITALAHALSWAMHPLIMPLYLLLVLFSQTTFSLFSPLAKWYMCGTVVLLAMVAPTLVILLLRFVGWIKNLALSERRERVIPLLVGAICYLIAASLIGRIDSATFLRKLLVAAALAETLCALITARWQISLHVTAAGVMLSGFIAMNLLGLPQMFAPMLITLLGLGALGSARLYLGKHNLAQVAAGALLGLCSGFFALFFL